ncbi:hypothetical protein Tco_1315066 [Tanacetum coccineum]
MATLPRCDEFREAACSPKWKDMFILYCRKVIVEDSRLAREINGLCDGLTGVIEEGELFIGELETLLDRFVPDKMCEFLKETQAKDTNKLMNFDTVQTSFLFLVDDDNSERSERFAEEAFGSAVVPAFVLWSFSCYVSDFLAGMVETIVCTTSSMRSCGGVLAKAIWNKVDKISLVSEKSLIECVLKGAVFCLFKGWCFGVVCIISIKKKSMAALPKCEELQMTVNSSDWSVMFIHHCRREISKDLRLSQKINALCARLTDIVVERERFIDELDRLVRRAVPERMAEFMKEVQNKDMPNRLKLQILSREFELRAREKDIFIEKLKGNMDF